MARAINPEFLQLEGFTFGGLDTGAARSDGQQSPQSDRSAGPAGGSPWPHRPHPDHSPTGSQSPSQPSSISRADSPSPSRSPRGLLRGASSSTPRADCRVRFLQLPVPEPHRSCLPIQLPGVESVVSTEVVTPMHTAGGSAPQAAPPRPDAGWAPLEHQGTMPQGYLDEQEVVDVLGATTPVDFKDSKDSPRRRDSSHSRASAPDASMRRQPSSRVRAAEQRCVELQHQLAAANKQIEQARAERKELRARLDAVQPAAEAAIQQHQRALVELTELRSQVLRLNASLQKQCAKTSEAAAEAAALQARVGELEASSAEALGRAARLEARHSAAQEREAQLGALHAAALGRSRELESALEDALACNESRRASAPCVASLTKQPPAASVRAGAQLRPAGRAHPATAAGRVAPGSHRARPVQGRRPASQSPAPPRRGSAPHPRPVSGGELLEAAESAPLRDRRALLCMLLSEPGVGPELADRGSDPGRGPWCCAARESQCDAEDAAAPAAADVRPTAAQTSCAAVQCCIATVCEPDVEEVQPAESLRRSGSDTRGARIAALMRAAQEWVVLRRWWNMWVRHALQGVVSVQLRQHQMRVLTTLCMCTRAYLRWRCYARLAKNAASRTLQRWHRQILENYRDKHKLERRVARVGRANGVARHSEQLASWLLRLKYWWMIFGAMQQGRKYRNLSSQMRDVERFLGEARERIKAEYAKREWKLLNEHERKLLKLEEARKAEQNSLAMQHTQDCAALEMRLRKELDPGEFMALKFRTADTYEHIAITLSGAIGTVLPPLFRKQGIDRRLRDGEQQVRQLLMKAVADLASLRKLVQSLNCERRSRSRALGELQLAVRAACGPPCAEGPED